MMLLPRLMTSGHCFVVDIMIWGEWDCNKSQFESFVDCWLCCMDGFRFCPSKSKWDSRHEACEIASLHHNYSLYSHSSSFLVSHSQKSNQIEQTSEIVSKLSENVVYLVVFVRSVPAGFTDWHGLEMLREKWMITMSSMTRDEHMSCHVSFPVVTQWIVMSLILVKVLRYNSKWTEPWMDLLSICEPHELW